MAIFIFFSVAFISVFQENISYAQILSILIMPCFLLTQFEIKLLYAYYGSWLFSLVHPFFLFTGLLACIFFSKIGWHVVQEKLKETNR